MRQGERHNNRWPDSLRAASVRRFALLQWALFVFSLSAKVFEEHKAVQALIRRVSHGGQVPAFWRVGHGEYGLLLPLFALSDALATALVGSWFRSYSRLRLRPVRCLQSDSF